MNSGVWLLLLGVCLSSWVPAGLSATDNGPCASAGLDLPAGFCATKLARLDVQPRHIAVDSNGTVYANTGNAALVALIDADGDGRADRRHRFGRGGGTGLTIHDDWLYAATPTTVDRYRLTDHGPVDGSRQHIVTALPTQSEHSARGLAIDDAGHLYVAIGAPSNACQARDRGAGSKGQDPCPLLKEHGGVWQFSATDTDQHFANGTRFATGVRNLFALDYDQQTQQLYGAQMGRDQLHGLWPDRYSARQSANLPAEVLLAVNKGDRFGWPYCYYDPTRKKLVLGPEYGGNGQSVGRCHKFKTPAAAYPAHWSPEDVLVYAGTGFPARYRGGLFIAFHGSWNRAPFAQQGFRVVFQPLSDNGKPAPAFQTFAGPRGFTGHSKLASPRAAEHRPAGLAEGPNGALYISDDQGGTIYRITHVE